LEKLILFDFDGVIIDGMDEYWQSSLIACEKYLKSPEIEKGFDINREVSDTFIAIRPWVKYGWEMVLITHEICKKDEPLNNPKRENFIKNYKHNCQAILNRNSWNPYILQRSLDNARNYQIKLDKNAWLKLHRPFGEIKNFIQRLQISGIKIGIITTKGKIFATEILHQLKIYPELIFGYEDGKKVDIISRLIKEFEIQGFIEDRKETLMKLITKKKLKSIPYYLASWGYVKANDLLDIPQEINVLKLKDLKDLKNILAY